ncbi:sphingolipid C9-methyltransferase [Lentinula edodes]|nr:sphingolipid C9-methyltransferase [Lentinula edodes]
MVRNEGIGDCNPNISHQQPREFQFFVTSYPAITNTPLVGLAEGNDTFSNLHLAVLVPFVPWLLKRLLPLLNCGGFKTYLFLLLLTGLPTTLARRNEKVRLPGKNIEEYMTIKDPELKKLYNAKEKIPMQLSHDAFFDRKNEFNDLITHSPEQDADQSCPKEKETLEQLQDNKLAIVCSKLNPKPEDRLLDIGCGWGTLAAYTAKNFHCDATGVPLTKNQTEFGNNRIKENGISSEKSRILCCDFREIAEKKPSGTYTKIVTPEMAEHVRIRGYKTFLRQVYSFLDDDDIFVFQVAGVRQCRQHQDLNWGLFMNKYVFPGTNARMSFWAFFLAWSVITSSASIFQITLHKDLNADHRVEGVKSHASIHIKLEKEPE